MNPESSPGQSELVPLAERGQALLWFRVLASALVIIAWVALPEARRDPLSTVAVATGAYLALAVAMEAAWRMVGTRAAAILGGMLVADGVYLAAVAYVLFGDEAPLRYLILVHVMTVALLASYRTGVKLAFWHSLLLLCAFHAREAGLWGDPVSLGGPEYRSLMAYIASLWIVALATATFAAVNERELRRRRYDLEQLGRLSLGLESAGTPREVADALLHAAIDSFGFERAALAVSTERGWTVLGSDLEPEIPGSAAGGRGLLAHAAAGRDCVLVSALRPEADPLLSAALPGAANLVAVPLAGDGGIVGVLVCARGTRSGGQLERRIVAMLERAAAQAALALAKTSLLERLERSSLTDGLTNVANRRAFDLGLAAEVARAGRTGGTFSLVMLDIDHFKRLNDTHGHQTGDEMLTAVARVLDGQLRGADTVARYGGEEFAVLLPDVDGPAAVAAAERLQRSVGAMTGAVPVTASAGVATYPADARDGVSLLGAADAALYRAKEAGRDRVVTASR